MYSFEMVQGSPSFCQLRDDVHSIMALKKQ